MNEPAQRQSGRPLAALSLRHLHYFVTLAGTLSFRRAADLLAITSPALSHSIAETERLLNARLFDRQGREVALSQIGEAILPLAERLLNNADGTIADMVDVARNVEQTVKLALIPSMARGVCALLSELQLKHHGLKFEFLDMPTDHIVRAVETGEVDIGVGVAHWAIGKPLETAPMTADEIVAVIRKDHQLAGSEETTWAILQAHPLAHFVRGSVVDLAGGSVASRQVAIQARYQVTFTETLYALVRAGFCLGIVPQHTAQGLLDSDLKWIRICNPYITREIVVMKSLGPSRSTAVSRCFDFLKESSERVRQTAIGHGTI